MNDLNFRAHAANSPRFVCMSMLTGLVFFFAAGCASSSQSTADPDSQDMQRPSSASASNTEAPPAEPKTSTPKSDAPTETGGELLPPDDEPGHASVDAQELNEFVKTYRELEELRQSYEQRLAQAGSRAEAEAIQQEAITAMDGAIQESPLSPERFAEIADLAQQDPELNQKILERL